MNSVQESKQELKAAIRYAENAISSAKQTIESMEFRQEMAKKQYTEKTGREESLTKLVKELEEANEKLAVDNSNLEREVDKLRNELHGLLVYRDLEEARGRAEGEVELLQRTISELEAEVQRQQDLGQGYYDNMMTFKAEVEKLREDKERLTALEVQLRDKIRELKAQVKQ